MISFQSRTLVNGAMLRNFSGQHVSIHVNVPTEVERQATSIQAKTTDDMDVTISLSEPLNAPVKGWIEVIGVPTSPNAIRNKEVSFIHLFHSVACYCEIVLVNEINFLMKFVCCFFNFIRLSSFPMKIPSHTTRMHTINWSHFGTIAVIFINSNE